jgi:tRNA (Thr-GGU) A37 N-methylase
MKLSEWLEDAQGNSLRGLTPQRRVWIIFRQPLADNDWSKVKEMGEGVFGVFATRSVALGSVVVPCHC